VDFVDRKRVVPTQRSAKRCAAERDPRADEERLAVAGTVSAVHRFARGMTDLE
jgi:hypothetical protein